MSYGEGFPCRACGGPTMVLDSRPVTLPIVGAVVRRRRKCKTCEARVTTHEIESSLLGRATRHAAIIEQLTKLRDKINGMLDDGKEE